MSIEEYPYSKYPDFCQGAFYLMQISTAEKLYDLFQTEFFKNFIWMEDVLLTGRFLLILTSTTGQIDKKVIFIQINIYILGIFTMLGNIKLMGMSDRLFNFQNGTEQKSPIAIFTHDLDPEERKTQFTKQFLARSNSR